MTYRGHIEKGVVVLDEPVQLRDGTRVEIFVPAENRANAGASCGPSHAISERLKPFIGMANGLPADAAVNHDHYSYGASE